MLTGLDCVWYVRETLKTGFPPSTPIERRLVAVLYTFYFDESGTHDGSEAVVVAGCRRHKCMGAVFCDWKAALKDCGLEYSHTGVILTAL
jgi:hypothetical protein